MTRRNIPKPDLPASEKLIELAHYKMPFGKYKGVYLSVIPESYYIWFKQQGFPSGKLGRLMQEALELKSNGRSPILRKIRTFYPRPSKS